MTQPVDEAEMLAPIGINPDRSFGPNWEIRDGRAHHVNERPGFEGHEAVECGDGVWRLAPVDPDWWGPDGPVRDGAPG